MSPGVSGSPEPSPRKRVVFGLREARSVGRSPRRPRQHCCHRRRLRMTRRCRHLLPESLDRVPGRTEPCRSDSVGRHTSLRTRTTSREPQEWLRHTPSGVPSRPAKGGGCLRAAHVSRETSVRSVRGSRATADALPGGGEPGNADPESRPILPRSKSTEARAVHRAPSRSFRHPRRLRPDDLSASTVSTPRGTESISRRAVGRGGLGHHPGNARCCQSSRSTPSQLHTDDRAAVS